MDDGEFCANLVDDICSSCEEVVRDHASKTIHHASLKSGKAPVALAVAVSTNGGDPVCHTHMPCTIVVESCPYCRKYGNVFAPDPSR